jgi:hypothetical protein
MPTILEVADQLAQADLPVIFLDTCILLDVMRAIKRRYANCVDHAVLLHAAATVTPRQCSVVVSHIVQHEWHANQQMLLQEASRHLAEIHEQSAHFHDACRAFGIAPGFPRANYAGLGIADRLHSLSWQLLNSATLIDADNECSGRALNRVINNIPPSTHGGEAKDCTILEEYLAVCRRLHAGGFAKRMVFCTSNKKDYCDPSNLHLKLVADFAAAALRFTSDLSWGFHDVTH